MDTLNRNTSPSRAPGRQRSGFHMEMAHYSRPAHPPAPMPSVQHLTPTQQPYHFTDYQSGFLGPIHQPPAQHQQSIRQGSGFVSKEDDNCGGRMSVALMRFPPAWMRLLDNPVPEEYRLLGASWTRYTNIRPQLVYEILRKNLAHVGYSKDKLRDYCAWAAGWNCYHVPDARMELKLKEVYDLDWPEWWDHIREDGDVWSIPPLMSVDKCRWDPEVGRVQREYLIMLIKERLKREKAEEESAKKANDEEVQRVIRETKDRLAQLDMK
ncbi:hypothetical protein BJ170DRAFT_591926 [Xylariales sp. AK1849]|nr:hypothetical protein BJ170DRAFT_591926 [Xylariales sp. AK1849]